MKHDLLRMAVAAAHRHEAALDAAELATMCCAVQMNTLEQLTPAERWAWLSAALMSPHPAYFFNALRACAGLKRLLPEIDALFGVPQLSDGPEAIDVGAHQLRVLEETARARAPLAVRFAALLHKIGMAGTPREIWPSHYKHEQRGQALLDAISLRFTVSADALALARLVIDECERVHRASDLRAGPIAALLERLQALEQPERFEDLLSVCTCDYAAYPGHSPASYPKAPRLRRALAAYAAADVQSLAPDAAREARAQAIAHALHSSARLT